jgi:hypothetical protein
MTLIFPKWSETSALPSSHFMNYISNSIPDDDLPAGIDFPKNARQVLSLRSAT